MWEAFKAHLSKILPDTAPAILDALVQPQFPSIRYNPAKPGQTGLSGNSVPWEPLGLQLDHSPSFIRDPHWHAGAYYVQESSSMFLGHILRQWLADHPADHPLLALDLCAAPGGKSTQLLDVLPANALLVSNELVPKRNAILRENLIRWGRPNVVVTQNEPVQFQPYAGLFDLVVVDAPCSGEGLFRRDKKAIQEWSVDTVQHCAVRQHEILQAAAKLVQPGGLLLYSTCTYEPSENEAQVERLLLQGFELLPAAKENFPEISGGLLPGTFRFYPHRTPGSGFFIAGLKKIRETNEPVSVEPKPRNKKVFPITATGWPDAGAWIDKPEPYIFLQTPFALHAFPVSWEHVLQHLNEHLHITYFGCELGERKKDIFIPAHALALSAIVNNTLAGLDLSHENALKYLRKENFESADTEAGRPGWKLIRYMGQNLGWAKVLPGRINNYLPAGWRILH